MTSPESDPIKQLQELTTKAGESLGDDVAFDAAVREINERLLPEELRRLDELLNISRQYKSQLDLLRETRLIWPLSDGSEGMIIADEKEYPVPSLLSIVQRFCEDPERYELLRKKVEQGFTKLIMVPFHLPIWTLKNRYAEQLKEHKARSVLFREGGSPMPYLKGVIADLQDERPVYILSDYNSNNLIYFPWSFDPKNHGGLTKQEAIDQKGAWQVYLVEETSVPHENKAENKNGRVQIRAHHKPVQYLESLQQEPQYAGEVGLTLELWFMRAMTRLEERDEVTDDPGGNGCSNFILGTKDAEFGEVPMAGYSSALRQVVLTGRSPQNSSPLAGASTAVMI